MAYEHFDYCKSCQRAELMPAGEWLCRDCRSADELMDAGTLAHLHQWFESGRAPGSYATFDELVNVLLPYMRSLDAEELAVMGNRTWGENVRDAEIYAVDSRVQEYALIAD